MKLGYWKLDGDATDYSFWGNDGTVSGVSFDTRPLLAGNRTSAHFNGVSSISVPHDESLNPLNTDFYIECFIHKNNENFTIIEKTGTYSLSYNGTFQFSVTGTKGTNSINSDVSFTDDVSHVIASYRASTGDIAFFVNGQLGGLASGTPVGPVESVSGITIGSGFDGELDNLILGRGVINQREALRRYTHQSFLANYETFVVYDLPYTFIPLGEYVNDTSGSETSVVWTNTPSTDNPIIYGMGDSSLVVTESATVDAPASNFSVSVWFKYSNSLTIFQYSDATLDCLNNQVRLTVAGSPVTSQTIRTGQLVMVTVNFGATTESFVNKTPMTSLAAATTATTMSFFGSGQVRASAIEIASPLSQEQHDRRYSLGFTGRPAMSEVAGTATTSVAQAEKVLNFAWNNYTVKR